MFITRLARPEFLYETAEGSGGGEQAPATTEGTPETGHDAGQQTQAEVDWQKRYGDLQPEYTRATQEAASLRQREESYQALLYSDDPDTRRQAAQALGIELADEELDDTQYADDPMAALQARQDRLEQQFTGDLTARQQQEQLAAIEAVTEQNMDSIGIPKEDSVRDWIVSRAVMLTPTPEGHPDVAAAYQEFQALIDSQKKQWASTKRTQHFAPGGGEGTQAPDLSTHQGRVQHMLAQLQNDEGLA